MKASIRVSPICKVGPYTLPVCGKGKSEVTLIEIRVVGRAHYRLSKRKQ